MKVSIVVDEFDLYCITTTCRVVVFVDYRGECPACHQPGESIPGSIGETIDV